MRLAKSIPDRSWAFLTGMEMMLIQESERNSVYLRIHEAVYRCSSATRCLERQAGRKYEPDRSRNGVFYVLVHS